MSNLTGIRIERAWRSQQELVIKVLLSQSEEFGLHKAVYEPLTISNLWGFFKFLWLSEEDELEVSEPKTERKLWHRCWWPGCSRASDKWSSSRDGEEVAWTGQRQNVPTQDSLNFQPVKNVLH